MSLFTSKTPVITPRQTIRHTGWVNSVVHLPDGRYIITSLSDGSLRLWDLESGAQIGEDWRDENSNVGLRSMALSPNGKTIASGGEDGNVRLWDVEKRKVIAEWTGHTHVVQALCWSANGDRVASGSRDGTARVWDVDSGKTVLRIKTRHLWVYAVVYSPDSSKIATGGDRDSAAKIWDAKTGERLTTLKHNRVVFSLAWTSDRKKLISGSYRLIRIFDTATWQQTAILEGHTNYVKAISLSQNNHLLASASFDKTARLWNLDTNIPVGQPLKHKKDLWSAALSPDGKVLVTACESKNAYIWDVHAILKEVVEDIFYIDTNVAPKDRLTQKASQDDSGIQHTPRFSLNDKSFLEADATRCPGQFGDADELPPTFFDGMEVDVDPSDAHPHSSANPLLARLSLHLRHFRYDNSETTELPQHSRPSWFHAALARLSLVHRSSPESDAPDELQQPSTPSRLDPHVLLARLSPRSTRLGTAGCPHSSALNPAQTKKSNSRNVQAVLALLKWLQYVTSRLWLLLGVQNSRKQIEYMSNKLDRTAKPRRRHLRLNLLRHPFHGCLKLFCFSAVHLHHTPMVTNTIQLALQHLDNYFAFTSSDSALVSLS
ncbi:WD40-repeat-containing domain protein [Suillus americanus]|nr:WD40-repeat-containing domain protein [Suillus americanus]